MTKTTDPVEQAPATTPAGVVGRPRFILRAEGAVLLAAALLGYAGTDQPWWLALLVLLVPDLFMVGYARSSRAGALAYNVAHSYPLPAVLGLAGLLADSVLLQALALVWFAHIGMDRVLGYGLKYDDGFSHTHLGTIGRPAALAEPASPRRAGHGR